MPRLVHGSQLYSIEGSSDAASGDQYTVARCKKYTVTVATSSFPLNRELRTQVSDTSKSAS